MASDQGLNIPADTPYPFDGIDITSDSEKVSDLKFFLEATGIPSPDALKTHAQKLRTKAHQHFPYPCIRDYAFLSTKAAWHDAYPHVLELGRNDREAIYMDLGCFFGTDVRKVVDDGWNPHRAVGSDLHPEWFELGHEFFDDKISCPIAFIPGDVFSSEFLATPDLDRLPDLSHPLPPLNTLTSLNPLRGRIRAISAFSLFHLFNEESQYQLARKLAGLLDPTPGSVIFGSHSGGPEKATVARKNGRGGSRFVHSPESWKELWEKETFPASSGGEGEGVRVKVTASLTGGRTVDGEDKRSSNGLTWSVVVL